MLPGGQLLDQVRVNVPPVSVIRPAQAVQEQPHILARWCLQIAMLR